MIDEKQVRRYCREDLSLIENYDEAVRSEEPYHCHHRYELNDGLVLSVNDLKNMGLYYKRPASELIFLKRIDHHHLHTIGSVHPLYGKHCSEETKEKIRKSLKGKCAGEKHPFYGKHFSEEHKKKIGDAKRGEKNYFHNHKFENEKHYRSKPVIQIDKETGEVVGNFLCASTAARYLKIHKSNIHDCCKGKQKTAGGFCWKYACCFS